MKLRSVFLAAVPAMALSAGAVYQLTPAPRATRATGADSADVGEAAGGPVGDVVDTSLARFVAGSTVAVDARLANTRAPRDRGSETFLLVEARGANVALSGPEPAAHLGLVIDRSGSMRGARFENAKSAALAAVSRLKDGDVVSVVTFDTRAEIAVPPTTLDAVRRDEVSRAIASLTLGGDTCVSCGVESELDVLGSVGRETKRMIVLSDGDTNNGIRDEAGLRALARKARDRGVTVTTIGVDLSYNERVMAALAEGGEGRHYFVQNAAGLPKVFEDEASSLKSSVAESLVASIELSPGVELVGVLDRSFDRQGTRVLVPMGSLSKGEVKTVLLQLRVPAAADKQDVARVDLRFDDLVSRGPGIVSGALALRGGDDADPSDPFVMARVERSRTADALEDANRLFKKGDAAGARATIARQKKALIDFSDDSVSSPDPFSRGGDAVKDSKRQLDTLEKAESGFATPPDATPGAPKPAADNPFAEAPAAAVRENQAAASDNRR
jgi:Ca-activated chloride channel family protein